MANCSGVQPGGKEALECLERNIGRLSAACKTAVGAVAPKPAAPAAAASPAPAPTPPRAAAPNAAPAATAPAATAAPAAIDSKSQDEQLASVRQACTMNDFMSNCSWIQPSSPEVLLCLKANAAKLSPGCQTAVQELPPAPAGTATAATPPAAPATHPAAARPAPAKLPQTAARPATLPPPPPAAAPTAPRQPTPEEVGAIRAACQSDFMSHCRGVQPGGPEAMQCLERNAAQLSPPCRGAVAALARGPGPGAAAAAAPPPPLPPALFPMPPLPLRVELEILRVCGADQRVLCGGVPPGGGRVIACLAQNAPSLSPPCRAVMVEAHH
jgi:hypothetical protein